MFGALCWYSSFCKKNHGHENKSTVISCFHGRVSFFLGKRYHDISWALQTNKHGWFDDADVVDAHKHRRTDKPTHALLCAFANDTLRWLRLVGSLKLQVSFAEYYLFYRALLQKKPVILRSLLIVASPYDILGALYSYSSFCKDTVIFCGRHTNLLCEGNEYLGSLRIDANWRHSNCRCDLTEDVPELLKVEFLKSQLATQFYCGKWPRVWLENFQSVDHGRGIEIRQCHRWLLRKCWVLCCSVLQCFAVRCIDFLYNYMAGVSCMNEIGWDRLCCSVLLCGALCCSLLQCLQCVVSL